MTRCSTILAISLTLPLLAGCGGKHLECGNGTKEVGNQCVSLNALPDPLLGAWVTASNADRSCEFFGDGEWDNTCFITAGWPIKWERIYEDRYVISSTITACDVTTAFASDARSVTLTMFCGRTQAQTVALLRIR